MINECLIQIDRNSLQELCLKVFLHRPLMHFKTNILSSIKVDYGSCWIDVDMRLLSLQWWSMMTIWISQRKQQVIISCASFLILVMTRA